MTAINVEIKQVYSVPGDTFQIEDMMNLFRFFGGFTVKTKIRCTNEDLPIIGQ